MERWLVLTSLASCLCWCAVGCRGSVHPRSSVALHSDVERFVGRWYARPRYHFWGSTMELRGDGTFWIATAGAGSDLSGRWRPVKCGVELCIMEELEVSYASDPPRVVLRQIAEGRLDANPRRDGWPTAGAEYYERGR